MRSPSTPTPTSTSVPAGCPWHQQAAAAPEAASTSPVPAAVPLFQRLLAGDIKRYADLDGRPVGEQRVPEIYRLIPTELRSCPYPGSRHRAERPMNVSALRQMTAHWDAVRASLALIHGALGTGEKPTYLALWCSAMTSTALLPYLAYRAERPVEDGALPVFAAALHKVVLGINPVVAELMVEELASGRSAAPATPEGLYDYVERQGWFLGQTEVCAGPEKLVLQAFRAFIHGDAGRADSDQHRAPFAQWVGDGEAFFAFAARYVDLTVGYFALVLAMRGAAAETARKAPYVARGADLERLQQALARGQQALDQRQHSDFVGFARQLDKLGRGPRKRVVDALAGLTTARPGAPPRKAPPAAVGAVCAALAKRSGDASAFAPQVSRWLVEELLIYLTFERHSLRQLGRLAAAVGDALGHDAPAPEPTLDDLQRISGPTTSALYEALLDVRVDHHHRRAAITVDGVAVAL